ncbi:MAG: carboxypeptidase regulatory-like domain-containing protein [Bryobacterales bacterium]|nr:carboxypeptidase regulatory-like domain-containing protein [Bryobacterales bacterium]
MRKFGYRSGFTALVLAMLALTVASQTPDGLRAVEGIVHDSSGEAVNGAIVQLKDMKTLQIRSFITRENGAFVFQGIKKSVEYELKAKHQNRESKPKLLTIFDDRQRANIDLKLED